jgi:DNA polymerase III epsilon subunit family exonuclease
MLYYFLMDLSNMQLAFFDVETTGLDPSYGDRICEVGILLCHGFEIEQEYGSFINPQKPVTLAASAISGITDDMVKDAPLFAEVSDEVVKLLSDSVIVCHNVPFDMGFLANELTILNKPAVKNKVIDTLQIARQYFSFPSNSLPNIAGYLKIKTEKRHRALADVHTTRKVLMHFVRDLVKSNITQLEHIFVSQQDNRRFRKMRRKNFVTLPPIIEEIIRSGKELRVTYVSRDGDLTERTIIPEEIVRRHDYLYLIGYCYLRKERRTFRLDRILNLK